MAKVKQTSKVPAGPLGNFNYEFECECRPGKTTTLKVTAANDNAAKLLAEGECDDYCAKDD
jgi:hypothetical protein